MANISVQKQNGGTPVATAPAQGWTGEWDPFRMMRELMRWDPFAEMAPFARTQPPILNPAFEVKETRDAYVFKADLPGIKPEDIEVHLRGNRLTIAGKREAEQQEQGDTYYAYERAYGSFQRLFTLPDGVDAEHIRAELQSGVLTVALPKRPEAQAKKVQVQTAERPKT